MYPSSNYLLPFSGSTDDAPPPLFSRLWDACVLCALMVPVLLWYSLLYVFAPLVFRRALDETRDDAASGDATAPTATVEPPSQ